MQPMPVMPHQVKCPYCKKKNLSNNSNCEYCQYPLPHYPILRKIAKDRSLYQLVQWLFEHVLVIVFVIAFSKSLTAKTEGDWNSIRTFTSVFLLLGFLLIIYKIYVALQIKQTIRDNFIAFPSKNFLYYVGAVGLSFFWHLHFYFWIPWPSMSPTLQAFTGVMIFLSNGFYFLCMKLWNDYLRTNHASTGFYQRLLRPFPQRFTKISIIARLVASGIILINNFIDIQIIFLIVSGIAVVLCVLGRIEITIFYFKSASLTDETP